MGYTEDLAEAQKMKAAIERYGVKVSIELQAGAGDSWSIGTHRLIMSHHTASRPSQGLTPTLGIVKLGRPDVPGPLANGYMGYDGVYRILTFGRANHPGAGGPVTFDGVTVPRDNGRPYIWGTEFEGGYEPYTEFMHDRMARANAGLTDYFADRVGATVEANLEHKTWAPLRKPDRIGYTREISIERINAVRSGTATTTVQEDEMSAEGENKILAQQAIIMAALGRIDPRVATIANNTALTNKALGDVAGRVRALGDAAPIDTTDLAPLLASEVSSTVVAALADLVAQRDGGLTADEVRTITEQAVRSVFASAAKES